LYLIRKKHIENGLSSIDLIDNEFLLPRGPLKPARPCVLCSIHSDKQDHQPTATLTSSESTNESLNENSSSQCTLNASDLTTFDYSTADKEADTSSSSSSVSSVQVEDTANAN
jgi:hypothetical protein